MIRFGAASVLALLVGCSTQPIRTELARPVSPEGIQAQELTQPSAGTVPVVVKRDDGATGSGCAKQLYLQGKPVARLWPGEKVTLYLRPGVYVLSAGPAGICGGKIVEAELRLVEGDPPTYRLSCGANFDDSISRTAF